MDESHKLLRRVAGYGLDASTSPDDSFGLGVGLGMGSWAPTHAGAIRASAVRLNPRQRRSTGNRKENPLRARA